MFNPVTLLGIFVELGHFKKLFWEVKMAFSLD